MIIFVLLSIGYSSKLLTADMQVFLVDGRTEEEVCGSLTKIKRKIDEARADFEREHGVSLDKEDPFEVSGVPHCMQTGGMSD